MARKHWTERLTCSCGKVFRNYNQEAVHRHNFPIYCRRPKKPVDAPKEVQ